MIDWTKHKTFRRQSVHVSAVLLPLISGTSWWRHWKKSRHSHSGGLEKSTESFKNHLINFELIFVMLHPPRMPVTNRIIIFGDPYLLYPSFVCGLLASRLTRVREDNHPWTSSRTYSAISSHLGRIFGTVSIFFGMDIPIFDTWKGTFATISFQGELLFFFVQAPFDGFMRSNAMWYGCWSMCGTMEGAQMAGHEGWHLAAKCRWIQVFCEAVEAR